MKELDDKKNRSVVYTCLIGGYDKLINHKHINPDWDYVCFTDDLSIANDENSSWKIRPLEFDKLDDVRNQRWHKLHPHLLFPEYEESLYLDTNIDILNENIFNDIEKVKREHQSKFSLVPHFSRKDIYAEFDACEIFGKDEVSIMKKQKELIKKTGFSGEVEVFFENGIIYRRHNDEVVMKIMDDWWWWVENYSRRDQLSLSYVLWKNDFKVFPLTEITYRNNFGLEFMKNENHVTKEELLLQKNRLNEIVVQRENEIKIVKEESISKDLKVEELKGKLKQREYAIREGVQEIQIRNQELIQKEREINFMKSSKFWKLRELEHAIKFFIFHPFLFIKKYKKRIKGLYLDARRSLRREGVRIMIIRSINFILFRKGFLNRNSNASENVNNYKKWIKKNEEYDIEKIKEEMAEFSYRPKISIITPVYNVDAKWLDKCIQSVLNQFYENWELCLHDDASIKEETIECLKKWEKKDSRIKISYGKENQHISGASNEAIKLATGEFIALLDNDDELSPDALFENVKILNDDPAIDFIYSDEDKIDEYGVRSDPFFKPGWSPDLFYSLNYVCHLSLIRKEKGDGIEWFRKGFEGAQDFDLFLRFFLKTKKIKHISKILYHWRKLETSTACSIGSKPYAHNAGKKALEDFLKKNKTDAFIGNGYGETNYRLKYMISGKALVSIVLPFKDKVEVLRKCVKSIIDKTSYKNYELVLVDNGSSERGMFEYLNSLAGNERIRILKRDVPFNFSAINNWAVSQTDGQFILFLNNDTEVISSEWLSEMLMNASRKDIGAVGALLYYPNKTIQHAGVILGMTGLAGHIFSKQRKTNTYYDLASYVRNYLAVTAACLMISREKFEEVGGFDERFTVCGNDVDLCLKLYERGYLNIYTPYAELYHYESLTRDKVPPQCDYDISVKRYAQYIGNDPYYNINLSLEHEIVFINTK